MLGTMVAEEAAAEGVTVADIDAEDHALTAIESNAITVGNKNRMRAG